MCYLEENVFFQWRFPPNSSSGTPRLPRNDCFHVLEVFSIISNFIVARLNENMRLQDIMNEPGIDNNVLEFPRYLLKVEEGKVHEIVDSSIEIPSAVNIVNSSEKLVESGFCSVEDRFNDVLWLTARAILDPTNSRLNI